jgi:hypothetical protein
VVAYPIGDGLQSPQQGLHDVHEVSHPLKSFSKRDFKEQLLILRPCNFCIFSPSLIEIAVVVEYYLAFFPQKNCQVSIFCKKACKNKISLKAGKIHQNF